MGLGIIQDLVKQGKSVITADDSTTIDMVLNAIAERKTATFYLKPLVFSEIWKRHWTLERASKASLKAIDTAEAARIKSDFKIELDGWSSVETCPRCQASYGTYQFIQQGIKEHGEDAVRAVFSLEDVGILQVHPRQNTRCQGCGLELAMATLPIMRDGHDYWYDNLKGGRYACCL